MNNQNSAGKTLFKLAASAAIIALVLSVSRLFLSSSDRSETFMFAYNLAQSSQMTAFLSVVLISLPFIIIGALISKEYDIIGVPMVIGGLASLIFITTAAYLVQSFSRYQGGDNVAMGEFVLTSVIFLEWLILLIYTWKSEPQGGEQINQLTNQPPSNQPPPQQIPPKNPPSAPPVQPNGELTI